MYGMDGGERMDGLRMIYKAHTRQDVRTDQTRYCKCLILRVERSNTNHVEPTEITGCHPPQRQSLP